jgi:hypothetical protein
MQIGSGRLKDVDFFLGNACTTGVGTQRSPSRVELPAGRCRTTKSIFRRETGLFGIRGTPWTPSDR